MLVHIHETLLKNFVQRGYSRILYKTKNTHAKDKDGNF